MRRRWGKPITQVQRFVPQYCQTPCTCTLQGAPYADYNGIRIDWNGNGYFNGGGERNAFHKGDRTGVSVSSVKKVKDLFLEKNEIWVFSKPNPNYIESQNKQYTSENYYSSYNGNTIYYVEGYTGTSSAYLGVKDKNQSA